MLLRIIIENFLSFREIASFDMFPNLKRTTFNAHIYHDKEIPLLKQAAIYGANGSGKSNFIKAIKFLRSFVLQSNFLSQQSVSEYRHKLAEECENKPISLIVEFFTAEKYFLYQMEASSNGIDKEALFLSGLGKKENELIFSRTNDRIELASMPSEEVIKATSHMLAENPFSSVMSLNRRFPIIADARVADAFNWFENELEIVTFNAAMPQLIHYMDQNSDVMNFAKEAFTKIGLGISDMSIRTESFEEWAGKKDTVIHKENGVGITLDTGITAFDDNKPLFSISVEDGVKKVKEFVFNQLGKDGFVGELGIRAQSDGTVRLLMLIPAIYEAVKLGHTVIVDEINHSIHPTLIRALLSYFSHEQTNGQLIYTTHETCLLNQQHLMRPDEVWFTEKHEGTTHMYSLNDFKVHATISIENGYMQGRYGAIPFIGEL